MDPYVQTIIPKMFLWGYRMVLHCHLTLTEGTISNKFGNWFSLADIKLSAMKSVSHEETAKATTNIGGTSRASRCCPA
jgi:hypothetical protein